MLDANIAIAALNGVDAVRSHLEDVSTSEVGIPIVALGQDAVLVTNDQGLLDVDIDGLRTANWLAEGPAA